MIASGSCNCFSVIQATAEMPNMLAPIPLNAHSETDDRPSPAPKISMISESAAAAMERAKIAAQQTGLELPESTGSAFEDYDRLTVLMVGTWALVYVACLKNNLGRVRTGSFIDAVRQAEEAL